MTPISLRVFGHLCISLFDVAVFWIKTSVWVQGFHVQPLLHQFLTASLANIFPIIVSDTSFAHDCKISWYLTHFRIFIDLETKEHKKLVISNSNWLNCISKVDSSVCGGNRRERLFCVRLGWYSGRVRNISLKRRFRIQISPPDIPREAYISVYFVGKFI